jgi:GntR family transcriptional regulator
MAAVDDPSLPRHRRVYALIADEIATGARQPGDRLPAERTLCRRLGVSRATLRRALGQLAEDGLVEPSHGRGHFVAGGPLAEPPSALMSFTELGRRRGLVPSARVLRRRVQPASLDEAEAFGIAPGAEVLELRRLRMLDGVPVAVDSNRVPLLRAPGLLDVDFTTASLYAALDEAGCGPVRAAYSVAAAAADAREAQLLDLAPRAPVLVAETNAYDRDDRLVELARTVYRGDRYRFDSVVVRRR